MVEIRNLLKKEKDLSIRNLAVRTKSQWRTVEKALETMKELDVVVEEKNMETDRIERLFNLKLVR